ncbi:MAG TPA: 30S ribosomal protein S20 [Candidatus Paceibacterota bacterium]
MPITKSAQKALRQTKRRTTRNRAWKQKLKDAVKKAEAQKTKEAISYAFKIADKTAKVKVIHKNKSARIKSKLSKLL